MGSDIVKHAAEGFALVVRALRITDKLHHHLPLFEHNLFAAQPFAQSTQGNNLHQLFALVRNGTETVDKSLAIGIQFGVVFNIIKFAIKPYSLAATRNIGLGEVHFKVTLYSTILYKRHIGAGFNSSLFIKLTKFVIA